MGSKCRLIACEEAWSIPEVAEELRKVARGPSQSSDKLLVGGIYDADHDTTGYGKMNFLEGLKDIENQRLPQMDEHGVDMHLLTLTAPGVQMFDADTATELAALSNDRMAEIIAKYPTRFAGLASFAPHSPKRAAKQIDRVMSDLKLNGLVVNGHTNGEYLDDPKFWPIFEAAEALDRPIYIHPRNPSDPMADLFRDKRLQSAIWGFAIETGTHAMRLIVSEVFDRFPKLQIVLGHMGENIPFYLWRSDYWFERRRSAYKATLKPSEIMKRNFLITTSGVEHEPALRYSIEVLGADRIMWAIDYPYQPMPPAVDFLNGARISEADRAAISHRNAERAFHLPIAR
jgi:5-carboxyvanillate decarboxylase